MKILISFNGSKELQNNGLLCYFILICTSGYFYQTVGGIRDLGEKIPTELAYFSSASYTHGAFRLDRCAFVDVCHQGLKTS